MPTTPATLHIDPKRTALLVMDLQVEILPMIGDNGPPVIERAATVIAAARAAHVQIIYVAVGFRPGFPEIDHAGPTYAMVSTRGGMTLQPDIVPAVKPEAGDLIVVKHRTGAFSGTDLDMLLRVNKLDTLVLFGISTSGVVLSTVRHANDHDYKVIVVKDCCVDGDDEVHRVLTEKVFARHNTVVTASDVTAALRG